MPTSSKKQEKKQLTTKINKNSDKISARVTRNITKVTETTKMATQMSAEQFKTLLETITGASNQPSGSFSRCTARFAGLHNQEKLEEFITTISIYKDIEKISDDDAIKGLPLLLEDYASTWWQGVKSGVTTWESVLNLLRNTFAPSKPSYKIYLELFEEKQDNKTSTDAFICKKRALLSQLPEARHSEEVMLDLVYGLLNINIRKNVSRDKITTFKDLLEKARDIENVLKEINDVKSEKENKKLQIKETGAIEKKVRCKFCRYYGHTEIECRKKKQQLLLKQQQLEQQQQSLQEAVNTTIQPVKRQQTPEQTKIVCYGCGKPGFVRSNCPSCSQNNNSPTNVNFYSIKSSVGSGIPTVPVNICGLLGVAHMDTAAKTSVAGSTLYNHLKDQGVNFSKVLADITLANGQTKQQHVLTTKVNIIIGNRQKPIRFIVLPDAIDNRTLLGIDFLEKAGIILNLAQRTWQFIDQPNKIFEYYCDAEPKLSPQPQLENIQKKVLINTLPILITPPRVTPTNNIFDSFEKLPDISPTTCDLNLNYSPHSIQNIFRDAIPTDMITPPRAASLFPSAKKARTSRYDIFTIDIELREEEAKEITANERNEFKKILNNFKDLFQDEGEATPYACHRIETGTNSPISTAPYRLSPTRRNQLKKELDVMLEKGIIEECESPWAAPVVMVPKKDGGIRVCIDYRRLNAITIPDSYPLPRMDDLLHAAKKTKYMSTLDLKTGYWQISVDEQHRDKTAFITPFGLFRFTKMPFGLRNAPATFQRLMDRFRTGLADIVILCYLDDIIVCSESFQQHLSDLQKVFIRMRQFKLRMQRHKCNFCCTSVKYLGHELTKDGIRTDPSKTNAILTWTTPVNIKQLLSFLQTCSWYRRFVPKFAEISRPLTRLTKKNVTWSWGEAENQAFQKLKQLLTTAPVLQQADESKPYILRTDASNYALGAVLIQGEGKDEHPIEYASRTLTNAEKNYTTTEKEALAVIWSLSKFRGYIEGGKVIIQTDHQPLKWLLSLKSPTGRLARWALQLQPYVLDINYIPGRINTVADALSRLPQPAHEICNVQIDIPAENPENIREEQLKDPDIKKIINSFESSSENEDFVQWTKKGYVMNNGILYRYLEESDTEEAQLVVPVQSRKKVLEEYHDSPTAGHYGVERTLRRINARYYWPGMRREITNYVNKCIECQRYKAKTHKPQGLLQTPVMQQRFEVLAIDLFGPLPCTAEGHQWIFIIEDTATRWVELTALKEATAMNCATFLLNEIFMRYGLPRRVISDNGTQFVSAIMQCLFHLLGIQQALTPAYHPEANPVERKNRDLKVQLSILVERDHTQWAQNLPAIQFAMNSSFCQNTGCSSSYLMFGRELRTLDDVRYDFRQITQNFLTTEIQSKISKLQDAYLLAKETYEKEQQRHKVYKDQRRQTQPFYKVGDLVWLNTHVLSSAEDKYTSKFVPKRDGPYTIVRQLGATTYQIAHQDNLDIILGTYHASALTPYKGDNNEVPSPVRPLRKRGRPKKNTTRPFPSCRRIETIATPEGETVTLSPNSNAPSDILSCETMPTKGKGMMTRQHVRRHRLVDK